MRLVSNPTPAFTIGFDAAAPDFDTFISERLVQLMGTRSAVRQSHRVIVRMAGEGTRPPSAEYRQLGSVPLPLSGTLIEH